MSSESITFIDRFNSKNLILGKNDIKSESIKKLTHLYLNGKRLEKIGDLSACPNLKVLYLHNNKIKQIEHLSDVTSITHLYLQWNKIRTLNGLNNLRNLKKLYIGHNEISRLDMIDKLDSLQELHIEKQRLNENEEFEFDGNCLNKLSKTLRVLNVSGLNLTNLLGLVPLYLLTVLVASDNTFSCVDELAASLGQFPYLIIAEFQGCPAQKDLHYRDKIISGGCVQLELLDGKSITYNMRNFAKNFQKFKIENPPKIGSNKLKKSINNSQTTQNPNQMLIGPAQCVDVNDETPFISWNSLQPKQHATATYILGKNIRSNRSISRKNDNFISCRSVDSEFSINRKI